MHSFPSRNPSFHREVKKWPSTLRQITSKCYLPFAAGRRRSWRSGVILPENKHVLSLAAHKWLRETASTRRRTISISSRWPSGAWRMGSRASGRRDRPALEEQVGLLFGWKPENVLAWLVSNPNGPDPEEQEENLRQALVWAQNSKQAAAVVLNEIYSRMKSQLPVLQPAASEDVLVRHRAVVRSADTIRSATARKSLRPVGRQESGDIGHETRQGGSVWPAKT
jgi:hypothetical protein